jgi:branched-chain amino acid aminotransferase
MLCCNRADVLPGVTRASILELAASLGTLEVLEAPITLQAVQQAATDGDLLEVFGAGTAAVISPVNLIKYAREDGSVGEVRVPTGDGVGAVAQQLWTAITDIQYGRTPHAWSVKL